MPIVTSERQADKQSCNDKQYVINLS